MQPLPWVEGSGQLESLPVCLRAILTHFGCRHSYEELVARLGLGGLIVAARGEPLGYWPTFGRDIALRHVGEQLGLRIRDLHPPEASSGLSHSTEYHQHFQDSYLPLIDKALAHEQPVLVWRGWPAPRDHLWGVVVERQNEMLLGQTLMHDGRTMPLTGPGHQVYIVEGWEAPRTAPGLDRVFEEVLQTSLAQWNGTWIRRSDLITGQFVYDAWQDELRDPRVSGRRSLHQHHPQAVRALTAARRNFATWLRTVAGGLRGDLVPRAATWAASCDRLAETLAPYESNEYVLDVLETHGPARLCEALEAARQIEAETYERLRQQKEQA